MKEFHFKIGVSLSCVRTSVVIRIESGLIDLDHVCTIGVSLSCVRTSVIIRIESGSIDLNRVCTIAQKFFDPD